MKAFQPRCSQHVKVFISFLLAVETEAISLHGAAAAAGLDPGPANVQPRQLGTVLEELLDGDVTHVQLRRQRVFFLHGHSQLLEDLCGGTERERENGHQRFDSHTRSTYRQTNKQDKENQ